MTQSASQSEPVEYKADYVEDEIELIEIFRIIWKWKFFILGGTLACAIAAIIISSILPKIYRVEMVIRPGILSFGEDGENIYIDTPDNIKALIQTGAFGRKILDNLEGTNTPAIPEKINFNVTLPQSSSTLIINYETPNQEMGIIILKLLGKFLMEEYTDLVEYYQNEIDKDISIKNSAIKNNENIKRSHEINIENISKRIKELEAEIAFISKNTADLASERNKLLSKGKNESNILSLVLYSNTIQQNLQLANEYKNEIKNLRLTKESQLQQISILDNELQTQLAQIGNLQIKKRNIQNIQIIQDPYSSRYPIKPKRTYNLILASLFGLIFMVFLSFFIEYISRNKEVKTSLI